jgi:hypothetical protein
VYRFPDPLLFRKSGSAENRTRGVCVSRQMTTDIKTATEDRFGTAVTAVTAIASRLARYIRGLPA